MSCQIKLNNTKLSGANKLKGLKDDSQSSMDTETAKLTRILVKVTDESPVVCFICENGPLAQK